MCVCVCVGGGGGGGGGGGVLIVANKHTDESFNTATIHMCADLHAFMRACMRMWVWVLKL